MVTSLNTFLLFNVFTLSNTFSFTCQHLIKKPVDNTFLTNKKWRLAEKINMFTIKLH